jgi:hypothetical protein
MKLKLIHVPALTYSLHITKCLLIRLGTAEFWRAVRSRLRGDPFFSVRLCAKKFVVSFHVF